MCGIVGQVHQSSLVEADLFQEMRDTLFHRGPDGAGTKILNDGKAALGHRRLSIIDLSEKGTQPMCNEDGTIWLTFNGEIYNYKVLKQELVQKGHEFYSNSDSEVLIHGFEEWGIEQLLNNLKGMFAFAIWDSTAYKLFLARDRFGIKPLYYYQKDGTLIFGSELKAIVKNPVVKREIDYDALSDYFVQRFIPAPKTIWRDVKKLPPANYAEFEMNKEAFKITNYWELSVNNKRVKDKELFEKAEQLLYNSVSEHLVSDVPVGLFLSGGLDSSTIACLMNQQNYSANSYSIGFKNWHKSEHNDAKEVAQVFNMNHKELMLGPDHFKETNNLAYFYDEPLGGNSFVPTYLLSKLASEDLKVVMGGDGGDEIFSGYKWHHKIHQMWKSTGRVFFNRKWQGNSEFLTRSYADTLSWSSFTYSDMKWLLNDHIHCEKPKNAIYKGQVTKGLKPVKSFQLLDKQFFLPEVVLTKLDRASMANSLEARIPFLDHEIAEFIFEHDESCYFSPKTNKPVLNNLLKPALPDKIINKPKRAFGAPIGRFININYASKIYENSKVKKDGILNEHYVKDILGNGPIEKAWAILIFVNWYDEWM